MPCCAPVFSCDADRGVANVARDMNILHRKLVEKSADDFSTFGKSLRGRGRVSAGAGTGKGNAGFISRSLSEKYSLGSFMQLME